MTLWAAFGQSPECGPCPKSSRFVTAGYAAFGLFGQVVGILGKSQKWDSEVVKKSMLARLCSFTDSQSLFVRARFQHPRSRALPQAQQC